MFEFSVKFVQGGVSGFYFTKVKCLVGERLKVYVNDGMNVKSTTKLTFDRKKEGVKSVNSTAIGTLS